MFPSKIDFAFWQNRQPKPSWVGLIPPPRVSLPDHWKHDPANIDAVINAHAGLKVTDGERAAQGMVALAKSVRRREGLAGLCRWLDEVRENPGTVITPRKRSALARRWLTRLLKLPRT